MPIPKPKITVAFTAMTSKYQSLPIILDKTSKSIGIHTIAKAIYNNAKNNIAAHH